MPPKLGTVPAEQFDDLKQQSEAVLLGMWSFLITEVMFFGGLFLGYTIYRTMYPGGFAAGSHHLDVLLGAFNTAVLIGSSLTMAMAVHAAQAGQQRKLFNFLGATLGLGFVFLGVKAIEYGSKFHENLIPGAHFDSSSFHVSEGVQIFYSFYFAMTGMHAIHMVIGAGILITLMVQTARGRFTKDYFSPIEMTGLYWHFVDIVWIFLFPLLYLIGRHV